MRQVIAQIGDDDHTALKLIARRRGLGVEAAAAQAVKDWIDRGGSAESALCRSLIASVDDSQRVIADYIASVLKAE